MPEILLNLLAVRRAGQVTRARAFLRRFRQFDKDSRLVILKERSSLKDVEDLAAGKVVNVYLGQGRLYALRRMMWENSLLPQLMRRERLTHYLTFSQHLPVRLDPEIFTIVAVSNLAPFSKFARKAEPVGGRLRLGLLRHTITAAAMRASKVVALSNACKKVLTERGVDDSKIEVIPNGVEDCQPVTCEQRLSYLRSDRPYILSVSHFYRYKNLERLLEAYSLLTHDLQLGFRLMIVGRPHDEGYFRKVENMIEGLKLEERVQLIPGVDHRELSILYSGASLFVFPSLIENSPNILLESMSHGLPIVASDVEPMPEFGADAVVYFSAMSSKDLADKMRELLLNPEYAAALANRAKARAAMYSWDSFTEKVVGIWN